MNVEDLLLFYKDVWGFIDTKEASWQRSAQGMPLFKDRECIRKLLHCLFRIHNVPLWPAVFPPGHRLQHFMDALENSCGPLFDITPNDFFINANDCVYYFPNYKWTWLGRSLVCVTALQHRPFPGAYKLPFGEGFYWVLPKTGDHGQDENKNDNLPPYEVI